MVLDHHYVNASAKQSEQAGDKLGAHVYSSVNRTVTWMVKPPGSAAPPKLIAMPSDVPRSVSAWPTVRASYRTTSPAATDAAAGAKMFKLSTVPTAVPSPAGLAVQC